MTVSHASTNSGPVRLLRLVALASPLGLGLLGCASTQEAADPQLAALCPRPAIVAGLDETGAWTDPATRRADQRLWRARIEAPETRCTRQGDVLIVDIGFTILANPGPAFSGAPARTTYFVTVGDGAQQIFDKQSFPVDLVLDGSAIGTLERLQQTLPLGAARPEAGYEVLIGFEPTEAQVDAVERTAGPAAGTESGTQP